jgi:hypothetical protein
MNDFYFYKLKFVHYDERNPKGLVKFETLKTNYENPDEKVTALAIKGLKQKYKDIKLLEITKLLKHD